MTTSKRGRPPKGQERGYIERNGYRLVRCSRRNKYVYEHRFVMEQHLGRQLDRREIVHHINGDRHDNRVENLEVMMQAEHRRLHIAARVAAGVRGRQEFGIPGPRPQQELPPRICAWCSKPFKRKAKRLKCCSHSCGQKLRYAKPPKSCDVCGTEFQGRSDKARFCSRSCSNRGRTRSS